MFSITNTIIFITCLVSIAAFYREKIKEDMLFWPAAINSNKQYYRFLSYGLVHADIMHLAFNMWALFLFGQYVEAYSFSQVYLFGHRAKIFFLLLYGSAIVISAIPDYFFNRNNDDYRALGASGAVSAVIFAGILLNPKIPIGILFIPFAIPGYIFGFLFLALSAYLAKKKIDNIGHSAHFTGAIYGLLFTIIATKLFTPYEAVKTFVNTIMGW